MKTYQIVLIILALLGIAYFLFSQETICQSDWSCSDFGSCINNQQTRTCTDLNSCKVFVLPTLVKECTVPPEPIYFETNAVGLYSNYKSGTWIKVFYNGALRQFHYGSLLTAGQCLGTFLASTPEGYDVKLLADNTVAICNPSGSGYRRYLP